MVVCLVQRTCDIATFGLLGKKELQNFACVRWLFICISSSGNFCNACPCFMHCLHFSHDWYLNLKSWWTQWITWPHDYALFHQHISNTAPWLLPFDPYNCFLPILLTFVIFLYYKYLAIIVDDSLFLFFKRAVQFHFSVCFCSSVYINELLRLLLHTFGDITEGWCDYCLEWIYYGWRTEVSSYWIYFATGVFLFGRNHGFSLFQSLTILLFQVLPQQSDEEISMDYSWGAEGCSFYMTSRTIVLLQKRLECFYNFILICV